MKSRFKYSLQLCLIISAFALVGCGKKENKVNSNGISGSSPFYSGNPAFSGTVGAAMIQQVQSIKNNVTCMNGYRLTNDVSFNVKPGYVSGTRINGQWMPEFSGGGTVSKLWIGVSPFRDLMFVTQIANGAQVVGYNVTLSFCELKSSGNFPSVISNERQLRNFITPNGIILDSNTYCGYNVVDFAPNTLITSVRDLSNPYSPPDKQIPTSFTKPTCNGQF